MKFKTDDELKAMNTLELKEYEESLFTQWNPRTSLENRINKLKEERKGQLQIFNNLKNPDAPINARLKESISSLKYRIEDLEDELDDLIQDIQYYKK